MQMITHFLKSASAIIEDEINAIDSKEVEIIYKHFDKGEKGITQLKQFFESNKQITATNGHFIARYNDIIANEIVPNETLLFCRNQVNLSQPCQNVFNTSASSDENSLTLSENILNKGKAGSKILFVHENLRLAPKILKNFRRKKSFISLDVSKLKSEKIIAKTIIDNLKTLSQKDFILLDARFSVIKVIFDYLNQNEHKPTLIKYFGSIDGRFETINFPLIEITGSNRFLSLTFQELCEKIDPDYTYDDLNLLSDSFWRLEIPLLVSHATKQLPSDINVDVKNIASEINKIDGISDVFIGKQKTYAFQNFENLNKETYAFSFPSAVQKAGSLTKTFYPIQTVQSEKKSKLISVNFIYIDLVRITDINIGSGVWGCEFYLDIVSSYEDPLQFINFNNLSMLNSKFEHRLIRRTESDGDSPDTYRYFISANFDFNALADNYPFDHQHIFISMSADNDDKFGILQPVPWQLLDYDFHLDGWLLKSARTGYLNRKEVSHISSDLRQVIDTREEIRLGWTIARANAVTVMKVGIPLTFLAFLNYYTTFLPFEQASSAVGILTTTFLSGIALYFSTEKPQPLRMTTIDLIFIYYYIQVGLTIMFLAVASFISAEFYELLTMCLKFALPLSVLISILLLIRRIRSNRLRPRIDAV